MATAKKKTTAIEHGLRIVHTDDFTALMVHVLPHCQGRGTQGATQIINVAVASGVASGEQARHSDNRGIAWNRALDHIGKYADHRAIEGKLPGLVKGACINFVAGG